MTRFSSKAWILISVLLASLCLAGLALQIKPKAHTASKPAKRRPLPARVTARRVPKLKAAVSLPPTIFGQPYTNRYSDSSPTGPHLVFAHVQMSAGDYGKTSYPNGAAPSAAQYASDIAEAKRCGIDGFAADFGGLNDGYLEAIDNLLTAADADGHFQVFLCFDFSTFPEVPATIRGEIDRCITHPSYYTYKGRPFISCYAGEGGGYAVVKSVWKPVLTALRAQTPAVNPYFVPGFNVTDPGGTYVNLTPATAAAAYQTQISGLLSGLANGAWNYGAGLGPPASKDSGIPIAEIFSRKLKSAGLGYMASVSAQYLGTGHSYPNRFYNEMYGGEALDKEWTSIITNQAPGWVEWVTWNDDDEGSNLTNADFGPASPWPYLTHSNAPGFYKSKLGLQAENRYWIQWYKTGAAPKITNNTLYAYYRTQPAGMTAENDPKGRITGVNTGDGSRLPPDTIFIDTLLASPATLQVTLNGRTTIRQVPAGLFHSRVPFVPGTPVLSLTRGGRLLLSVTGEPIVAGAALYDWNYYTCTASRTAP